MVIMKVGGGPETWPWLARIYDSQGSTIGAGFLIDHEHVLTCAHIVSQIGKPKAENPRDSVSLDFPLWPQLGRLKAQIETGGWFPVNDDETGDLAVLTIDRAMTNLPRPPMRRPRTMLDHHYRCHGFPATLPGGKSSAGVIRGRAGPEWQWYQLEAGAQGYSIERGFSGAPVWDDESQSIVGMVVAEDPQNPTARVGWMIPVAILAELWPPLEGLLLEDVGTVEAEALKYLEVLVSRLSELPSHLDRELSEHDSRRRTLQDRIHQSVRVYVGSLSRAASSEGSSEDPYSLRPQRLIGDHEVMEWDQAVGDIEQTQAPALILADAGYGKSWLLARRARFIATAAIDRLRGGEALSDVTVPFHLSCARLADALIRNRSVISALLEAALPPQVSKELRDYLYHRIQQDDASGGIPIMLDALDDAPYGGILDAIEDLARMPQLHAMISSRPSDPRAHTLRLGGYRRTIELIGFDEEQFKQYVAAFLSDTHAQQAVLRRVADRPPLRALVRIPLLASFVCLLADHAGQLPEMRTGLIEQVLRRILRAEHRDGSYFKSEDWLEARLDLLAHLALSLSPTLQHPSRFISESGLVQALERYRPSGTWTIDQMEAEAQNSFYRHADRDTSRPEGRFPFLRWQVTVSDGILVRSSSQLAAPFEFFHQSVHEFLAAKTLAKFPSGERRQILWAHRWFETFWQETAALTAGDLVQSGHENQAALLVDWFANDEPADAFFQMLQIAARGIGEAQPSRALREQTASTIRRLTSLLRSASNSQRAEAAQSLIEIGIPAASYLCDELASGRAEDIKSEIARVLSGFPEDFRSKDVLLGLVNDPDPRVCKAAVRSLGEFREDDVCSLLLNLLQDQAEALRRTAIDALRGWRDERSIEALLEAAYDADSNVRERAIEALLAAGNLSKERLAEFLMIPSPRPRALAASALQRMRSGSETVDLLVQCVKQYPLTVAESHITIRQPREDIPILQLGFASGSVLVGLDRDAFAPMSALLGNNSNAAKRAVESLLADPDPWIRFICARALLEAKDERGASTLRALSEEASSSVRRAVGAEVWRLPDDLWEDTGLRLLEDPVPSVREAAARGLAGHPSTTVGRAVIQHAQVDDAPEVRLAIIRALGWRGEPEALDALAGALRADSEELRKTAAASLIASGRYEYLSKAELIAAIVDGSRNYLSEENRSRAIAHVVLAADDTISQLVSAATDLVSLYEDLRLAIRPVIRQMSSERWEAARAELWSLTINVLQQGANEESRRIHPDELIDDAHELVDKLQVAAKPFYVEVLLDQPGHEGEALGLLRSYLRESSHPRLLYVRGRVYEVFGDSSGAIEAYIDAAESAKEADACVLAGLALGQAFSISCTQGACQNALLDEARTLVQDVPLLFLWEAHACIESGDGRAASQWLARAYRNGVRGSQFYFLKGLALLLLGASDRVIANAYLKGYMAAHREEFNAAMAELIVRSNPLNRSAERIAEQAVHIQEERVRRGILKIPSEK